MNYIAMYVFIGFLSYFPIAKAMNIPVKQAKWHELLLASTIWATIWLPQLLYAIIMLQADILAKKEK